MPPRGVAVTAVVVGAAGLGASSGELGLYVVGAFHRARQVHDRGGGETTVQRVVFHHLPTAVDLGDAHHASAVGVDLFAHFFDRTHTANQGRASRVQGLRVDVFVVDRQQAVGGAAVDREEVHAIVVHAHRVGLVGGGVAAVAFPRGCVAVQRRAPRGQDVGGVAGGHGAGIGE